MYNEKDKLKTIIQELINITEWRDECLDARDWASWMKTIYREDYLLYKRWDKSLCHATKLFNEANEIYINVLESIKKKMNYPVTEKC